MQRILGLTTAEGDLAELHGDGFFTDAEEAADVDHDLGDFTVVADHEIRDFAQALARGTVNGKAFQILGGKGGTVIGCQFAGIHRAFCHVGLGGVHRAVGGVRVSRAGIGRAHVGGAAVGCVHVGGAGIGRAGRGLFGRGCVAVGRALDLGLVRGLFVGALRLSKNRRRGQCDDCRRCENAFHVQSPVQVSCRPPRFAAS